ncbi:hypothetical protein D3C71_1560750 [compost metagenome]
MLQQPGLHRLTGTLALRRLALPRAHLPLHALQVGLRHRQQSIQVAQLLPTGLFEIGDAGIALAQLRIGFGLTLRLGALAQLLGRRCRRHHTQHPPIRVEHLVAATDVFRGHPLTIQHHDPVLAHIAIQLGLRRRRAQQRQQQPDLFPNLH